MVRIYTYKQDRDSVYDILTMMADVADDMDFYVLAQFINFEFLQQNVLDPRYGTRMTAKYPERTLKGVEIRMQSYYFEDREGVVISNECSYIAGWLDGTNTQTVYNGVSKWIAYMSNKHNIRSFE